MALTSEERIALEGRLAALEAGRDAILSGRQQVKVRYEDWERSYSAVGADGLGALSAEIDAIKRRLGRGSRRFARLSF